MSVSQGPLNVRFMCCTFFSLSLFLSFSLSVFSLRGPHGNGLVRGLLNIPLAFHSPAAFAFYYVTVLLSLFSLQLFESAVAVVV